MLAAAGVPAGPINDVGEALADQHVLARDGIEAYWHERLGEVRRVRSPLRLSGARRPPSRGPGRGEHLAEVLAEAGISADERDAFAAGGAFGEPAQVPVATVEQS